MINATDFITSVLSDASKIANTNFGKVSGTVKPEDNNQVLTATDIEIGELIVSRVKVEYPEHNVIDEEAGVIDNGSSYTWVIDPIDGTSNFANGVHTYGVMIGLLEGDSPIAGGIALPYFNEIYVAERGKGAACNGEKLSVSKEAKLLDSLVAYGIDGHQENPQLTLSETNVLSQIILGIRNLRSSNSAYDIALVASGKYGASLNQTSKIWDNVAQHIIIEEAGGLYTDFYGQPMNYDNPVTRANDNFTYCAGSPTLHSQLQAIILHTAETQQ
jgi:myo-inositol-1(or 4)-monophosphatase